jgi:hypothetical protein
MNADRINLCVSKQRRKCRIKWLSILGMACRQQVLMKWKLGTCHDFPLHRATPPSGQGFEEASRLHSGAPRSVELLWTIDQPVEETSLPDNTQHSHQTDINSTGRIRTRNPNKREAADLHHMPERAEFQIFWIKVTLRFQWLFSPPKTSKGPEIRKSALFSAYRKFKHGVKLPELTAYLLLVPRSRKMV